MAVTAKRRRHIRGLARNIVARQAVNSAPVPIDSIVRSLGIALRYSALDESLSGMAFTKAFQKIIVVNALHHPNRQRFTIAHELAHHLLHASELQSGVHVDKVILRRDDLSAQGTNDFEIEANAFASELLMPRDLFERALEQSADLNDERQLAALASRFKVSSAALQLRFAVTD